MRIEAGAGVVASDDEMVRAVVATDDSVPESLARPGHPHRERQQREQKVTRVVVLPGEGAVRANAREVIDVARLGQADHRMKQQRPVNRTRGAGGQLFVGAVQRVTRLEGDDVWTAKRREPRANFHRRQTQRLEIVVARQGEHAQTTRRANLAPRIHLGDERVARVCRAIDGARFRFSVTLEDFLDAHHRHQIILAVGERDIMVEAERRGAREIERHGNGKECSVGEAHLGQNALVITASHKATERREAAGGQQFEVAEGARRQLHARQRACMSELLGAFLRTYQQINQSPAEG